MERLACKKSRIESVAEHIYGVQMLAIAMYSEYNYDIDLKKVIIMLAVHELEEIYIGDLTPYEITKKEKEKIGHKAIEKVLNNISTKDEIRDLILEFDARKTKEALFAFHCDKLEADLQCKLYDEEHRVDLSKQDNNLVNEKDINKYLDSNLSWSEMWLKIGQERYNYDKNFLDVSNYALNNKINVFKNENE